MLYHYTSLATLCAIIGGVQDGKLFLRASNAKKMNDPNDCYYFVNIVGQINHWDKYKIDAICKEKDEYDAPYLISLSKLKDDLHMWNCYGDDGKGVVIGFDEEKLNESVDKFFTENHIFARLYKCLYKSSSQIKNDLELASLITKNINKDFWNEKSISDISNILKHPCYKYEREYRIVIKHGYKEYTPEQVYNKEEDAFYLSISINAIKYIIAGPNANLDAIKKIFSRFFPKATFRKSIIPYRSK